MYRLTGARRSYDWGSTTAMFEFLGTTPDGVPFAELWLGAHPTGPATTQTRDGLRHRLDHVIAADTERTLGNDVTSRFGQLPYLVKLLAPARPLSIQVHPNREMASTGYQEEERRGVPLDDPLRSFKDEHNKPEMVYAITHFEGLVGLRDRDEVLLLLETVAGPLTPAADVLKNEPGEHGLRSALELILGLEIPQLSEVLQTAEHLAEFHPHQGIQEACCTVVELAQLYPKDIGAVVSLMLNKVRLQPGQLVFLADGVPHAYLGGFGLEIMGNSDNVLRLGMTTKHVDVPATLQALNFNSSGFSVETAPSDQVTHVFEPPTPEYALSITRPHLAPNETTLLPGRGPRIIVGLSGELTVTTASKKHQSLSRGQALFIPAEESVISASGFGSLAQAYVP